MPNFCQISSVSAWCFTWGRGARYSGVMYLSAPSPLVITGPTVSSSTVISSSSTCQARLEPPHHTRWADLSLHWRSYSGHCGSCCPPDSHCSDVWQYCRRRTVKFSVPSSEYNWPGLYRRLYSGLNTPLYRHSTLGCHLAMSLQQHHHQGPPPLSQYLL